VDVSFLEAAIEEARQGMREGGIPIGSVIVHNGKIIGRGHNRRVQQGSAIFHGEMDALENAGRQSSTVYRESVLYTTLSPCSMCSGAILLYGIPRVIVLRTTSQKIGTRVARRCDDSLWSPTDFESRPGTYALLLSSSSDAVIPVGRLGEQCTPTPGLRTVCCGFSAAREYWAKAGRTTASS